MVANHASSYIGPWPGSDDCVTTQMTPDARAMEMTLADPGTVLVGLAKLLIGIS